MNRRVIIAIIIIGLIIASVIIVTILLLPTPRNPIVNITSPSQGSTVSGIVNIDVTVNDDEILTSNIYIDGVYIATSNSYQWDTTSLPDGKHTIRAYAVDSSSNSDDASLEIRVDNVVETLPPYSGFFKVMVYNILESGRYPEWKTVVKNENPDILMLVETGYMEDNSNQSFNAAVSEINEYFSDAYPYDGHCAQNVRYSTSGEAILSRFPFLDFIQVPIVPLDDATDYDVTHDFIHAILDINGTHVHVIGGHLKASSGPTNQERREWEMEGMINYMDNLGDVPILYLSDQNSYSPFDTGPIAPTGNVMDLGYGPMTMLLNTSDEVYGQYASTVHNFTDVFRTLNPTEPGHTYGHMDENLGTRIDYIIVNQFFASAILNSTVANDTPAGIASDHYGVCAFFEWNSVSSLPVSLCESSADAKRSSTSNPYLRMNLQSIIFTTRDRT